MIVEEPAQHAPSGGSDSQRIIDLVDESALVELLNQLVLQLQRLNPQRPIFVSRDGHG